MSYLMYRYAAARHLRYADMLFLTAQKTLFFWEVRSDFNRKKEYNKKLIIFQMKTKFIALLFTIRRHPLLSLLL